MAAAEEMGDMRTAFDNFGDRLHDMHADMKTGFGGLRADFRTEASELRAEVAYLRGRFDVLIWAVGINAAATIAILGVLLRH